MRAFETILIFLASNALAAPADGQGAADKPVVQDGILQLPLFGVTAELETTGNKVTKRQASAELDRQRFGGSRPITALGIALEVGTPPQTVIVEPDTGSAKLWLPGLRDGQVREEPRSTFFDRARSSSIQDLGQKELSTYQSEVAVLNVFSDEISVGGKSLGKARVGVANMSESRVGRDVGTMGLLTPTDRWADDFILKKLLDQKVTKSRAFSAGVRTKGRGALTFGGYDTAKFSGPLEKLPMKPHKHNHYIVEMQSLSFSNGSALTLLDQQNVQGQPLSIGLDSGAPGVQLSMGLFKDVMNKLGAGVQQQLMTVDCAVVDSKAALDFKMTDSTTISVLLADLVFARLDNGKRCQLVIHPGGRTADLWVGVQYLRRSFVVYDPDQSSIFVARGADCGSNLVAIDGAMPEGVVGQCDAETPEVDPPAEDAPLARPIPADAVSGAGEIDIRALIEPRVEFEGTE